MKDIYFHLNLINKINKTLSDVYFYLKTKKIFKIIFPSIILKLEDNFESHLQD